MYIHKYLTSLVGNIYLTTAYFRYTYTSDESNPSPEFVHKYYVFRPYPIGEFWITLGM